MGCKTSTSNKTEVCCTSIFKMPANISGSINKLWAEVINALENVSNSNDNDNMQTHAYQNSDEFEVSD